MRFSVVFVCLTLLIVSASAVFPQEDDVLILKPDEEQTTSPEGERPDDSPQTNAANELYLDFYEMWRQFELQLKLGTVDQKLIAELIRLRNKNGIPKVTEFALSAVRFGQSKLAEKKPDDAVMLFRAASSLDPTLSIAYYSTAKALIASSWTNLPAAMRTAIAGMFAPLSTLHGKIYIVSKYAFILAATLLVLGAAFAVTMLAKYQKLLRHDTVEKYTSLSLKTANLLVWVVLFLPVFLFAGVLWLAPFWLIVFWKYMRKSEMILSIVFFLAFMFEYTMYQYVVRISVASVDPSIAPFMRVFSDGPSPRLVAEFREYSAEHSKDQDGTIMLGYLYRADRNYVDSIKVLQKHILEHPSDARALNNLGHIYFLQGETDIALRMVQKAEGLDHRSAIYPYNLSILQRAKFNFANAEDSLAKARQLGPEFVRKLEENPYSGLVDSVPTEEIMVSRMQQKAGKFGDFLFNPFTIFSFALLMLSIFRTTVFTGKPDHAKECIKCGRPFCKRCQPAVKELRFCTQCLHIFVKKDGVSPASRKDKMREIEEHSRRQDVFLRMFSLVLPGFGNLYKNRIWFGIILLFFWFLFLILIFYNIRFAPLSFYESPGSTAVLLPVFLIFLVLLYLVANVSLFRKAKA